MRAQQALYAIEQFGRQRHRRQRRGALGFGEIQQAVKQRIGAHPEFAFRCGHGHGGASAVPGSSCAYRKARARSHSRLAVRSELPCNSAISAKPKPAK